MALAISPATDALAHELASLRGVTPDEAVAEALRAELEREQHTNPTAAPNQKPSVEEMLAMIRSAGPWKGPNSAELQDELYDDYGLPK